MKKKIFISGGSKGIGLAVAKKFYEQGFEVIICARGQAALEAAKAEMPGLHTLVCDLSDKSAVKQLAATLNRDYGPLDILINNGGVFMPGLLHKEEDAVYETQMRTNMDSTYYLTKGVVGGMIAQKAGMIVNMCSIASLAAYPGGGSYSVSKFAMLGFSKVLREEMKPYGIRVVSIMPGAVKTAAWDGVDLPEERFIPARDIAEIVWNAWIMSPHTVVEEIVVRPTPGDI
jgi:NADP-dependent 3-hydroxy acid dehydrogenase YdfG